MAEYTFEDEGFDCSSIVDVTTIKSSFESNVFSEAFAWFMKNREEFTNDFSMQQIYEAYWKYQLDDQTAR